MSIVLYLQILSLRSRPCMGSVLIFRILCIREMWFHSVASSFFEVAKLVNDLSSVHVCVSMHVCVQACVSVCVCMCACESVCVGKIYTV